MSAVQALNKAELKHKVIVTTVRSRSFFDVSSTLVAAFATCLHLGAMAFGLFIKSDNAAQESPEIPRLVRYVKSARSGSPTGPGHAGLSWEGTWFLSHLSIPMYYY